MRAVRMLLCGLSLTPECAAAPWRTCLRSEGLHASDEDPASHRHEWNSSQQHTNESGGEALGPDEILPSSIQVFLDGVPTDSFGPSGSMCFNHSRDSWMCFLLPSEVKSVGCELVQHVKNNRAVPLFRLLKPHTPVGAIRVSLCAVETASCFSLSSPDNAEKFMLANNGTNEQQKDNDLGCVDIFHHDVCTAVQVSGLCSGGQHFKAQQGCRRTCAEGRGCAYGQKKMHRPTATHLTGSSDSDSSVNKVQMPSPVSLPKWSPPSKALPADARALPDELLEAALPHVSPSNPPFMLADARRLDDSVVSLSSLPTDSVHPSSYPGGYASYAPLVSWSVEGTDSDGSNVRRLLALRNVGERTVSVDTVVEESLW